MKKKKMKLNERKPGPILQDGRVVELGDICVFRAGSVFSKSIQGNSKGIYPFIKVSDFSLSGNELYISNANNWISKEILQTSKSKIHPVGATVFAKIGIALTYNRRRLLVKETVIDNNMMSATALEDKVLPMFLYYLFTQIDFNQIAKGSALPYVNVNDLKRVRVSIPSILEQKKIVSALSSLDDKIELNRQINANLEKIASALFKRWFVDFEFPDKNGKPYKSSGGKMAHSEVGEIPEGWRVGSLDRMIEILSGGTPKTSNPDYWNGEIPWFSVVDAPKQSDIYVIETEKKITQRGIENSAAQILPEGTTIITARGTVGKIALVGLPMAMNQSCYGLKGKLDKSGLFTYLTIKNVVGALQSNVHGSVFDTITRETFSKIDIIMPSTEIIASFEGTIAPMFEKTKNNLLEIRSLKTIRDSLLPRLMIGKIRV
jgi:type I restriction enzyme S subunit